MAETSTSILSTSTDSQKFLRVNEQPENPFFSIVPNQTIAIIPSFTLESSVTLFNAPLSYKTWGELSSKKDNVMVVCHAFTGSADISEWWGPLLGASGRAFDITKFFIICMNSLGSPYGSASPVTYRDGDSKKGIYGPDFPLTTVRDDVKFHKMLLDELGVKKVAAVIGGSLGGMLVLEWAYMGIDYIRCIVPIATSSRQSAWGIGWGEAQRQSIYADYKFNNGYYSSDDPPLTGLGAARMSALLTYRSRDSFELRFSRNGSDENKTPQKNMGDAQSYLRYKGAQFCKRFDANCYISISRKLDTHDLSRSRTSSISEALKMIEQPTLVLGIESDGLFTFSEQEELASTISNSRLARIESLEGHDAFLISCEQVNTHILMFLQEVISDIMESKYKPEIEQIETAVEDSSTMNEMDNMTS